MGVVKINVRIMVSSGIMVSIEDVM